MRPCDIGANALYPFLKERSALAPSKRGHARSFVFVLSLEADGTPEQIEVMGYLVDSSSHYILGVGVPALGASTIVL